MESLKRLETLGTTEVLKFPTKTIRFSTLVYDHSLLEIWCYILKNGKTVELLKIDIQEIKEIRAGKSCKDFGNFPSGFKEEDFHYFTIYYGSEFRLKTLSLAVAVQLKDHADKWIEYLEDVTRGLELSYKCRKDAWLKREFTSFCLDGVLTLKRLKSLMSSLSINIRRRTLQRDLKNRNLSYENIPLSTFMLLIEEFEHDNKIVNNCFEGYVRDGRLYANDFQSFLDCEQGENDFSLYEWMFMPTKSSPSNNSFIRSQEALDFLFSKENQVWNPECSIVYQDMTRPLSHYWISCSHNTYLTGDQLTSESSVEAYVRCLKQGCRSIEVDCWNGSDGEALVYHGRTMTSKIKFCDVIQAIKDYGFATSEYPIIISLENHCNIEQQKYMAEKMHEVFGDMLISEPCTPSETELPSPEQLKRKIIIKGKVKPESNVGLTEDESEKCTVVIKSGVVHLKTLGTRKWKKYFCKLTTAKLSFERLTVDKLSARRNSGCAIVRGNTERWIPSYFEGISQLNDVETKSQFSVNLGCPVENVTIFSCEEDNLPYPYQLIIPQQSRTANPFYLGFSDFSDVQLWETAINNVIESNKKNPVKPRSRNSSEGLEHAEELSKLAIYAQSVKREISNFTESYCKSKPIFNHMTSLPENAAVKDMTMNPSVYILYHQVQFSRVYPTGMRFNSSNYDPTPLWNAGCQMVSLNYQTPDKALQLNHGKFLDNGRSGYILKPNYLLDNFIPTSVTDFLDVRNTKLYMKITIIAARHLHQFWKNSIRPFVQLELFGADFDKKEFDNYPRRTKSVVNNGLNPFWNEEFSCKIFAPELALLRFSIQHEARMGDPKFIGQATYPVCCLRRGYRSVQLRNGYGEEFLSVLLIKCEPIPRDWL